MTRRKNQGPTDTQIRVAISLLGLDKNGYKRTQTMVSDHLGMPKTTVCEAVRRLLDGGYVVLTDGTKRDKYYSTGPRFPFIESAIQARLCDKTGELRSVQKTRGATSPPDRSEQNSGSGRVNATEDAYSVHLAGSWLQFVVDRQGSIDSTVYRYTNPKTGQTLDLEQTIFGKGSEYWLDGSANWTDTFVLEHGKSYHIRYQSTTSGKRFFYVSPDFEVFVSPRVAEDDDAVVRAIVEKCTPLLIWLEKHAGWLFAKDEMGMYAPANSFGSEDIHRAYRGPLNELVTDLTGGAFVDDDHGVWADRSSGFTELETNRGDYIQAIRDLPQTRQRVNTMWAEWPATKENLSELMEKVDTLAHIVHRMYEIDRDLAQMGANAQRGHVMAANQTTFDQYPMDSGPSKSIGKPPEGYQ